MYIVEWSNEGYSEHAARGVLRFLALRPLDHFSLLHHAVATCAAPRLLIAWAKLQSIV
jgi:hypothetical protein